MPCLWISTREYKEFVVYGLGECMLCCSFLFCSCLWRYREIVFIVLLFEGFKGLKILMVILNSPKDTSKLAWIDVRWSIIICSCG